MQRENRGPYICLINSLKFFLHDNNLSVSEMHECHPGERAGLQGFSLCHSHSDLEDTEPGAYGPFHASCLCASNPEFWLGLTPVQQEH